MVKNYNNSLVSEVYLNLCEEDLNLSHRYFQNKYKKMDSLNLRIHNYYFHKLKEAIPDFDKKEIYAKLYPNESFNESKFTTVLNRHLLDLKEFIIFKEMELENSFINLVWSDFLADYRMSKNLNTYIQKIEKENTKANHSHLFKSFLSKRSSYYNQIGELKAEQDALLSYISSTESYFDYFRMQLYISLIILYIRRGEIHKIDELSIQSLIDRNIRSENLQLNYNAHILQLYKKFSEDIFTAFFNEIMKTIKKHSLTDQIFYTNNIQNFIVIQVKKDVKHLQYLYRFFVEFDKMDLLHVDTHFSFGKLNNIVSSCNYIRDYKMANYFLDKYHKLINHSIKKQVKKYLKAIILFEERDFKKTLIELSTLDYKGLETYILKIKHIEIMAFIGMADTGTAYSKLEALRKFEKENKLVPDSKKIQSAIVTKLFRKCLKPLTNVDKTDILSIIHSNADLDWTYERWFQWYFETSNH